MSIQPVWKGHAGHFVSASHCLFHLHTQVGRLKISTVGDYYPAHERHGNRPWTRQKIGADRYFETYVFSDTSGWSEIDAAFANDAETAEANHMAMIKKYLEAQDD